MKLNIYMGPKGDSELVKTVTQNPVTILLGYGQVRQVERFPNIIEDTYLPKPVLLLGLPYPLTPLNSKTGEYDFMIHFNEKLRFATHMSTELNWVDSKNEPLPAYLVYTDLCEAELPFTRYIDARPLELDIDVLSEETINIKKPSDIQHLINDITQVKFYPSWDEKGKLQRQPKIVTDAATYVVGQRYLHPKEGVLLEQMCDSALEKKSEPGITEINNTSLKDIKNYFRYR